MNAERPIIFAGETSVRAILAAPWGSNPWVWALTFCRVSE